MARKKQLSGRQLAVINDLFGGELDEQSVLDKHKVSRGLYNKWLAEDNFAAEFSRRIAALNRQGEFIIARYAALAAAKLVQLTESESQETARKACLDIISLPKLSAKAKRPAAEPKRSGVKELSTGTASRLLSALADRREKSNNTGGKS